MKKIKTYSNFVNEDTDISYYEVEYYDIVGEHGGFQESDKKMAFEKAREITQLDEFDPKFTIYVGTHYLSGGIEGGSILWATDRYLNIVSNHSPEQFLNALMEFILTKKPINWMI